MLIRQAAVWFLASLLICLSPARGRAYRLATPGTQESTYTYSVNVGLVVLPVSVTDRRGDAVSGLQEQDFRVYENGVPQKIVLFDHQDIPVAVGLVIDNSTSMVPKHTEVVLSSMALARASNPEDQIFVIHFNEHVIFSLKPDMAFTSSLPVLAEAVASGKVEGKTALYDAIIAGLDHLEESPLKKKVLVVISDGGDNASAHTLAQVLRRAETSQAVIYTIGLFSPYDRDQSPRILKELAKATGGEYFDPSDLSTLTGICRLIARDIRTRYTLGYISTNPKRDGTYRTVRVVTDLPRHRDLTVRTRAGYKAPKDQDADAMAHPGGEP